MMIFSFRRKFEILMYCKAGAALVTIARVRNASIDSVQVQLDGAPVRIIGRDVISGSEAYRGVTIEMQQNGRDVIAMLICPQTSDPANFASVYPKGSPALTVAVNSSKTLTPKFTRDIATADVAWPAY